MGGVFIWPALQKKQASLEHGGAGEDNNKNNNINDNDRHGGPPAPVDVAAAADAAAGADAAAANGPSSPCVIEQEEYEEDHANEERMFETMDSLLTRLHKGLSEQRRCDAEDSNRKADPRSVDTDIHEMAQKIDEITHHLKEHLFSHLDKEETHCMPLVVKHLNKEEIHDLVGKIMGKRSSDQMCNIMDVAAAADAAAGADAAAANGPSSPCVIEQEEYEEDHANEERMFETMDSLLTRLHKGLSEQRRCDAEDSNRKADPRSVDTDIHEMAQKIDEITHHLKEHLFSHLDKEETHCMPLVVKHLNKEEIHDLVGKIMGKRSSDQMCNIMTMAVQNLSPEDREEMIRYMKAAMYGTFFERWLTMSGWGKEEEEREEEDEERKVKDENNDDEDKKPAAKSDEEVQRARSVSSEDGGDGNPTSGACPFVSGNASSSGELCPACVPAGQCLGQTNFAATCSTDAGTAEGAAAADSSQEQDDNKIPEPTSQEELENLIRAVATNSSLTAIQKSTTIQSLRDSVHKSQMERKRKLEAMSNETSAAAAAHSARARRVTPPSSYWKKRKDGTIELVWSGDSPNARFPPDELSVPLFSASELAPTFFDGATAAILGCPHYARSCKVRHPASGRLYTCRHCCEQDREMPMKEQDSPLDRYLVKEIFCMKCNALQPVGEKCCNPKCGTKFARWFCHYCNLYDDSPGKNIYHCPFCNVCRAGKGLGIDYRHCMRCNACVSMDKNLEKQHNCISQKLQGNCPICHEGMFQTIKPLKALRCGHVMHMQCFTMYQRSGQWTCPLCKKSVEDMSEYFAQIDAAVRMQPMPASYAGTMSNIYCQDCCKSCVVPYHFVAIKCSHCGSYNTRELSRGVESNAGGTSNQSS